MLSHWSRYSPVKERVQVKDPLPTEAEEQEAVVKYLEWRHIPVYAIPNGGSRHKIEAANLKRQGVRKGVPDLCIPVAKGGYHGLYIEMKRVKGGRVDPEQRVWQSILTEQDYLSLICRGAGEAIKQIEEYMHDRLRKESHSD